MFQLKNKSGSFANRTFTLEGRNRQYGSTGVNWKMYSLKQKIKIQQVSIWKGGNNLHFFFNCRGKNSGQ